MGLKHYLDEIPPSTGRKYLIETDGDISKITDITEYEQVGTAFGANDVNRGCVLECNYRKYRDVHELTTENIESENIKFFATSGFEKGDTFTFNGVPVTAQTTDGQALGSKFFVSNTLVECRRKGDALYFTSASNNLIDDATSIPYRIGIDNGRLYIEEAN